MTGQAAANDPAAAPQGQAFVRVESGSPTPEDLAALVAVLSAVAAGAGEDAPSRGSAWSDPSWRLVGPSARRGGWAASALPR